MEILRSNQNATIRRLAGLRNNRRRRAAGVVLVDGARETRRAVESGLKMLGFYQAVDGERVSPDAEMLAGEESDLQHVRAHAERAGVARGVTRDLFSKICYGEAEGRCLAEFAAPGDSFADLPPLPPGLILVLDRLEKPGNLGAIFRSADAAGVAAVLLSDCPTERFNANAIRGSLGAVFTVPSASGTQSEVSEFLGDHVDQVLAMRVEGSAPLFDTDLRPSGPRRRIAVVLGSESDGLGTRWQRWNQNSSDDDATPPGPPIPTLPIPGIRLPMAGRVDSLNVSVSAALVAFEFVRQRASAVDPDARCDPF